jgi:hypothetical protein
LIRFVLVIVLIAALAHYKPLADKHLIAKSITGTESLKLSNQLIELKGTVLYVKLSEQTGAKLLTLQTADGQQPTAFVQSTQDIIIPGIGDYVSVTGKLLGKGVINAEVVKILRKPIVSLPKLVEPFTVNERVLIHASSIEVYPQRSRKGFLHGRYTTDNGSVLTLLVSELTPSHNGSATLQGYLLDSGAFYVERFF